MSKNITISEGENARVFGNTKKLKTLLQGEDAGPCFWVPEDETQANPVYITENGLHTAADAGEYGFSVAHVNVPGKVTDIDGIDWDITIDEDGIPHIEIDDINIPDLDIDIPHVIDIFIDPDTGEVVITIDNIPITDIDIDEIIIPDVDIDGIGVVDITITVDPETGEVAVLIDGNPITDYDIDSIQIDGVEVPGIGKCDITITVDPETGEVDVTVDAEINIDPEDLDLDPDEDIDISFDPEDMDVDIVGTDLDGDDVVIDLDPITGDFDTLDCPASIQVMHVPNKTEYTDGWAIDYDGLVVQAFDADGNPWSSPDYPDGYIPAHKLNLNQKYADYDSGTSDYETPDYSDNVTEITSIGSIEQVVEGIISDSEEAQQYGDSSISDFLGELGGYDGTNVCIAYNWSMPQMPTGTTGASATFDVAFVFDTITNPVNPSQSYPGTLRRVWIGWNNSDPTGEKNHVTFHPSTKRESRRLFQGVDSNGNVSSANMTGTGSRVNSVDVSWGSPCLNTFTASFDITVNEREDHSGSHHSGKF